MTAKMRFQLALAGFILSAIIFVLFTLIPAFKGASKADFIQGFSGGVAFGAFLGILHYRGELRRERRLV